MLTRALIISLSRNFWDDVWRSRQQVMSRLARTNNVVFVSRPLTVAEAVPWAPARSELRRAGAHRVNENLYAYVPPRYLPTVFSVPVLEEMLENCRRARLRRYTRRWASSPSILYLWHPTFEKYIDTFPGSLVCYHLFDDLSMYGNRPDHRTQRALERIFARADLVFVASEELVERYKAFGNVHWIPNGVDYELFADAAAETPTPADLAAVPHPRLGYAGSLRAQINIELMHDVAKAQPNWHIVLIGDVTAALQQSTTFTDLRKLPNVHVLGQKSRDEMPTYVQHLDLGLLPYRLDGAARFCYPLKMHEYLAAGLPVVSSDLSAVRPFTSVIRVADSVEEWVDAVAQGLRDTDPSRVVERREVGRANSWDTRVARIATLIAERYVSRSEGR